MSRDAELLRAIGLGPEQNPNPWNKHCAACGKYILDEIVGDDDCYQDNICLCGPPREVVMVVNQALGLDLPESEWTVEHDAAFARWVWPWLRNDAVNTETTGQIMNAIGRCLEMQPTDNFELFLAEWTFCPHPGPTMCRAIHAVLCGEKPNGL